MTFGRYPYGGVGYAAADVAEIPQTDTETLLAVEVSFTTGALETPAWVDIFHDVRSWDTQRGRTRELERFQPGRATVVLGNRERQYDSVNAAGPWFGNIRPMRRIRIRETFNGVTYAVFDGYVDKWHLDYPETGHDATATVTATDGFKIFQRTDLPRSVYYDLVESSGPVAWWRMSNPAYITNAVDWIGSRDLTYFANPRGGQRLVTNDENESTLFIHPPEGSGNVAEAAVTTPVPSYPFSVELIFRSQEQNNTSSRQLFTVAGNESGGVAQRFFAVVVSGTNPGQIGVALSDNNFATATTAKSNNRYDDGVIHHLVVTVTNGNTVAVWVDGINDTAITATANPVLPTGTVQVAIGNAPDNWGPAGEFGADAEMQDIAVYNFVLGSTDIAAHSLASKSPWQNDLPDDRITRVLDIVGWPAGLRRIDGGEAILQSVELRSMPALELLQKVMDTEFGLLFIGRDGNLRFIDRNSVFTRTVAAEVYGDGAGEVGYRDFTPDDGDDVIRNEALISRLNGSVRSASDSTSIDEFGRFEFVLEGLLHRQEAYSQDYADFIVAEYANPRRRITKVEFGAPIAGTETTVYPAILGKELGDAILVRSRPIGGGSTFEQTCAIEGISHFDRPGGPRRTIFALSPEIGAAYTLWGI